MFNLLNNKIMCLDNCTLNTILSRLDAIIDNTASAAADDYEVVDSAICFADGSKGKALYKWSDSAGLEFLSNVDALGVPTGDAAVECPEIIITMLDSCS